MSFPDDRPLLQGRLEVAADGFHLPAGHGRSALCFTARNLTGRAVDVQEEPGPSPPHMEAIHRTHGHAAGVFAKDARFRHHVRHDNSFPVGRSPS